MYRQFVIFLRVRRPPIIQRTEPPFPNASLFRSIKIGTIEPGFGIEAMRLVSIRCEPLGPVSIANILAGDKHAPDLVPLIDRLAGRLGARRLFRMSAVESDVPERSVRRLSPLDTPENWPRWPRPVRFFQRAAPVDNVIALLPNGPPRRFT